MERITRVRAAILLLIIFLILSLYGIRLFRLQIIEAKDTDNTTKYVTQTRVKASRGNLYDRNGNLLVGNRASYDLVFNHYVITSSDNTNESLYRLVNKCRELGLEYIDHFPITKDRPFEYTLQEYSSAWQGYFQSYLRDREMDSDITAPLLVQTLRERYSIPEDWPDDMARAVIGLRYEFDLRGVVNLPNYTLMEDVSDENLSALLEMNVPGLIVEASTVREYHTTYAAHILGTMGAMTEEQWLAVEEAYENGTGPEYYMDAEIGQSGLEAAFETYLHGVDGLRKDVVDKNGAIISQEYYPGKEPKAGNHMETTIDINIQMITEDALANVIAYLQDPEQNTTGDGTDVEGASVVVMEVKTGDVLACASYPTYNPQTYNEEYNDILTRDFDPLFNRALQGTYYPGSTYKMCTLVAGLRAGVYQYGEEIYDEGIFIKEGFEGFTPKCLRYSQSNGARTHENITSAQALEVSCNYFFYELAYRMWQRYGLEGAVGWFEETASGLGLGEHTGVELFEEVGYRLNAESKAATHVGQEKQLFRGDVIQCAIGQSTNMFTPIQQCVYASTLANGGVRMKATFMNRIVSSDYRTVIDENQPEIVSNLNLDASMVNAYKEGMKLVISGADGTARLTMAGIGVEVCAKTGTAQTGRAGSDDGYFVCFAPADDPEIAIAVHGEKAAHGATLGRVAKEVLIYYFGLDKAGQEIVYLENQFN